MDPIATQQALYRLYEQYYADLQQRAATFENNPSSPLLMDIFPEYFSAAKRLMIVGKETNSWGGHVKEYTNLEKVLECYKDFALGHGYHGPDGKKTKRTLNSPFWNVSRALFQKLNSDMDRKEKGFLWTNLSKMDSGEAYKVQKAQSRQYPDFAILKDEVKIVKPDVVVFLIGNDYNAQMQQYLNVSLELKDPDLHIYQVIDPEGILPTHSYKIYHPRYLYKLKTHHQVVERIAGWVNG